MRLVKWRPAVMPSLSQEMDDIFNNFFMWNRGDSERGLMEWAPRVNIREHDKNYELTAEIPGMEKDMISVEMQDGVLTIRGEKKAENETDSEKYHICERSSGKFARSFTLPDNVDQDKIEAEYVNGILKLSIPKTEKAKPREIKVNVK